MRVRDSQPANVSTRTLTHVRAVRVQRDIMGWISEVRGSRVIGRFDERVRGLTTARPPGRELPA